MSYTIGREGMLVSRRGEIEVWLHRPRRWLRPARWGAEAVIHEMITADLPDISLTIGPPSYGRTRVEALNKARDAAMTYMHGRDWKLRPQSDGIEDLA